MATAFAVVYFRSAFYPNKSYSIRILFMSDADSPNAIRLRPATAADEIFLLKVYKSSRGDDLRELGWEEDRISEFLDMQYEAQQRFLESEYRRVIDQIVLLKEEPAGHLFVERRDHEIRCIDVALMPEYRNAGIGTRLLRQLQDEAQRSGKPLRLQIIRFSRAIN